MVAETNGKAENIREPCATSLFFSEGKVLLEGVQKGAEEENEDMDKKPWKQRLVLLFSNVVAAQQEKALWVLMNLSLNPPSVAIEEVEQVVVAWLVGHF